MYTYMYLTIHVHMYIKFKHTHWLKTSQSKTVQKVKFECRKLKIKLIKLITKLQKHNKKMADRWVESSDF